MASRLTTRKPNLTASPRAPPLKIEPTPLCLLWMIGRYWGGLSNLHLGFSWLSISGRASRKFLCLLFCLQSRMQKNMIARIGGLDLFPLELRAYDVPAHGVAFLHHPVHNPSCASHLFSGRGYAFIVQHAATHTLLNPHESRITPLSVLITTQVQTALGSPFHGEGRLPDRESDHLRIARRQAGKADGRSLGLFGYFG